MKILIAKDENSYVEEMDFELVERKGVGHPDTMCDAIAECASRNYTQYCINKFGRPAHHWFDKVMLIGGEANIDYGQGEVVKPYTIIFAGKVSYTVNNTIIPVDDILYQSAEEVLSSVLTGFVADKHMIIDNRLVDYQGSGRENSRYRPKDVANLPVLGDVTLTSNDSNLLSAYAPLTTLENLVLKVENFINGEIFKSNNPDTGWDVKVFGSRKKEEYKLLVNMPFLAKDIFTLEQYYERKKDVIQDITNFIKENFDVKVDVSMNATDKNGRPYLVALGSVADTGDVGVVGRGNRINGLINPMRPMSIEAPAGKNPIDHTGKIYGVLAMELAQEIYEYLQWPVTVHIYTEKENRLDDPTEIMIKVSGIEIDAIMQENIEQIITNRIKNVGLISQKIICQGVKMW